MAHLLRVSFPGSITAEGQGGARHYDNVPGLLSRSALGRMGGRVSRRGLDSTGNDIRVLPFNPWGTRGSRLFVCPFHWAPRSERGGRGEAAGAILVATRAKWSSGREGPSSDISRGADEGPYPSVAVADRERNNPSTRDADV